MKSLLINAVITVLYFVGIGGAMVLGHSKGEEAGLRRGRHEAQQEMQDEAVKRGHAERVLVNNGPETKFVWKEGR